jgi:hypothetical protein
MDRQRVKNPQPKISHSDKPAKHAGPLALSPCLLPEKALAKAKAPAKEPHSYQGVEGESGSP